MPGSAISFCDVEHWFQTPGAVGGRMRALDRTTIEVPSGQFLAVVGPSGCGKTTLLNMVSGLVVPQTGRVLLNGRPPQIGAPDVGYLFARDALLPWRTAEGNISLALELRDVPAKKRKAIIDQQLTDMGLADFAKAYPAQLSHGMRQRVALARTLAPAPDTLLMDEPFSALDAQTRIVLQEQFVNLWEHTGSTVIFVTHDLAEAVALADRVVVMSRRPGRIKAEFPIELKRPRRVTELPGNRTFHNLFERIWTVFEEEVVGRDDKARTAAAPP